MIIKTDFVTNSSSSAFIVIWPDKVKTIEDVRKYIIKESHAKIIFNDIIKQPALKIDLDNPALLSKIVSKMATEMEEGNVGGLSLDYTTFQDEFAKNYNITSRDIALDRRWSRQFWDAYANENRKRSATGAIEFLEPYGGQYVYYFNYADEDGGIFTELEHENDWGGLPHIRISKH